MEIKFNIPTRAINIIFLMHNPNVSIFQMAGDKVTWTITQYT